MAITFNEIAELVARFGNSIVTEQANMAAPFVGKGHINKVKQAGTVGIVNVKTGGISATGFISDGGALPAGSNTEPVQLAYHPKALFSRLSVPRIAALTCISKQDGVNLVREQMETVGADLGRTLGRALFRSGAVPRPVAAAANYVDGTAGVINTPRAITIVGNFAGGVDLSGFRVGHTFTSATLTYTQTNPVLAATACALVVSSINYSTNQVSFTPHSILANGNIGGAILAPNTVALSVTTFLSAGFDVLLPLDGGNINNAMTSLLDLASSTLAPVGTTLGTTGNYSGIAAAGGDYTGSEIAVGGGGALTIEVMDQLSKQVKRRSGKPWTHTVMNSTVFHDYMSLLLSNRRFVGSGQANDAGTSSTATYEGKTIVVDENMPDQELLLFTDSDTKLAEWRDFQPDYDGKKAAMVSPTDFIYDTQIFGMYNVRCIKRNGLGKLTGISGGTWA